MKQLLAWTALALLLTSPVAAQETAQPEIEDADPGEAKGDRQDAASKSADERRAARIDMMFARLAKATDERRARRIARHIMRRMSQSGSDTTDLLMAQAGKLMKSKSYAKALDVLDGVVRLQPDFAEGWNRRATVYFLMGEYGRSIADIEQVLRREPRHWGALAGLSMILVAIDKKEDAIIVMDRALTIHPNLTRMKERREKLIQEVGGADI
ncbi:MAG: tetratricopeptide repeat protein [Pseudomonadota bacterium]